MHRKINNLLGAKSSREQKKIRRDGITFYKALIFERPEVALETLKQGISCHECIPFLR